MNDRLQTRTELLLIACGWLWTFSLAAINSPQGGTRMAIAAAIGLALSLGFRRSVMNFFRVDLSTLGDSLTQAYLWAIFGAVGGATIAAYALLSSLR